MDTVYKLLLRGNSAVLVGTEQKLEGIVTRIDVIEYLSGRVYNLARYLDRPDAT